MAPKMVTSFRRSLSFPNPPSHNAPKPRKSLHVRSTSLPCRSHPIISHLQHHISDLHHSWSAHTHARTSAWLCDGLRRLKSIHDSLDDLLHLPQTRDSLRCGSECSNIIENLLEDFLRFVDVHGTFQTLLLRLKAEHSAAQIAVRRKDSAGLAAHYNNLSKVAKEIGKLPSTFVSVGKSLAPPRKPYDEEAELVAVIGGVVEATVMVSNALFGGISSSGAFRKLPSRMGLNFGRKAKNAKVEGGICEFQELDLGNLRKKGEEEVKNASKKMHEMEDRISEIEECGERAFRSFINSRVSLLNVLTQ